MEFKMQCEAANVHKTVDGEEGKEQTEVEHGHQVVLNGLVDGSPSALSDGPMQARLALFVDTGKEHDFEAGATYLVTITKQ